MNWLGRSVKYEVALVTIAPEIALHFLGDRGGLMDS